VALTGVQNEAETAVAVAVPAAVAAEVVAVAAPAVAAAVVLAVADTAEGAIKQSVTVSDSGKGRD